MTVHCQDGWVNVPPLDEFSVDNAANSAGGRRHRLLNIDQKSPRFAEVELLFKRGWRHHKKDRPQVQFIFKVLWAEALLEPYLTYRSSVQKTVNARDKRGNEHLLFHGTNRACLLGESRNNILLCNLQACSLCSILRTSFDVKKCGSKNSFKRFGHGIYTTSCSSKADDYVSDLSNKSSLRVMLVTRVVVGRSYKRYRNATNFVAPPQGYDSVAGEIGWDLNYEETVTYHNDTIRPAYLVVYGNNPEAPITFKALVSSIFKTPLAS